MTGTTTALTIIIAVIIIIAIAAWFFCTSTAFAQTPFTIRAGIRSRTSHVWQLSKS
jgi:hypothetical protein